MIHVRLRRLIHTCLLLGFIVSTAAAASAAQTYPPAVQTLLDRARAANPQRYQFVFNQGAQVIVTPDQKSFALLWLPESQRSLPAEKRSLVVTMHGSNGFATDDLFLWFNAAQQHQQGLYGGRIGLRWRGVCADAANDEAQQQASVNKPAQARMKHRANS